MCERLKLDPSKLPRILAPLNAAMAARCGFRAGVQVVVGCGDTAASFLACGATREGISVDVAGTASVFTATTKRFMADTRRQTLSCAQAATQGLWHPYAYINGGGLNLEWFRNEIAGGRLSFDEQDRLAARIATVEDDLMFVPHLGGRVSPSWPRLGCAWAGLRWSHSTAHLYQAVREAVALEYASYRDVLRKLNPSLRLREVRVTGGGEKSALWNRIKADALGVHVVQIAGAQGAPMGAPMGVALVAGFGVGLFKDLDAAARAWIKTGRVTLPERKLAGHYARRLVRYEGLLELLNKW